MGGWASRARDGESGRPHLRLDSASRGRGTRAAPFEATKSDALIARGSGSESLVERRLHIASRPDPSFAMPGPTSEICAPPHCRLRSEIGRKAHCRARAAGRTSSTVKASVAEPRLALCPTNTFAGAILRREKANRDTSATRLPPPSSRRLYPSPRATKSSRFRVGVWVNPGRLYGFGIGAVGSIWARSGLDFGTDFWSLWADLAWGSGVGAADPGPSSGRFGADSASIRSRHLRLHLPITISTAELRRPRHPRERQQQPDDGADGCQRVEVGASALLRAPGAEGRGGQAPGAHAATEIRVRAARRRVVVVAAGQARAHLRLAPRRADGGAFEAGGDLLCDPSSAPNRPSSSPEPNQGRHEVGPKSTP